MQSIKKSVARLYGSINSLSLLFLIAFLSAPLAVAQDKGALFDPHPLRPADTSSPRDTLHSFNKSVNEAVQAWRKGEPRGVILKSFQRAFDTFDFSQLPERGKFARQIEAVLHLKEILDRIELPPKVDIPGDAEVADQEKSLRHWTIPNTRITIAMIKEGLRAGEFLFNAETISRLEEFYERAKDLPYKPGGLIGIYEDFAHSPGEIVPPSWIAVLPAWSKTVIFGETLWQWAGLLIVLISSFLVIRLLLRCGHWWDERHRSAEAFLRFGAPLSVFAGVLIIYGSRYVLLYVLRLISSVWVPISYFIWSLIFVGIGWFVFLVIRLIADTINDARQIKESSIDAQLVRTVQQLASLVILIILLVYAVKFFGIPLTPIVASIGIGGLAIALAVRPTLENVIGGLTLFADKPVRIGDYCQFGDKSGTVENIGLRSIRLRKRDDSLVSVPNADFSQKELTNHTQRQRRLYRTMLGLRYETTPEQLRYLIARLREMLLGHPKVSPDSLHVRFHSFGAYSLDVEVFAYIRVQKWLEYRAIREDINFRVLDIIKEAGTGFAFPSQTAYLGRDTGIDAERGREAETQVQEWRSKGQLPFPEFDEGLRGEKEDILDYPPEGTPGYKPIAGLPDPPPKPQAPPPAKPKSTKGKQTRITKR